jgi:hypothetical protein
VAFLALFAAMNVADVDCYSQNLNIHQWKALCIGKISPNSYRTYMDTGAVCKPLRKTMQFLIGN